MGTGARARHAGPRTTPDGVIAPGASFVLLRPRELRGTTGVVQRRFRSGWEVEVRTALGTPMHLTVPERALRLR